MRIDDKLMDYLEEIAALALTEDKRTRLKQDLGEAMDGLSALSGADVGEAVERPRHFDTFDTLREDVVGESLDRAVALAGAPDHTDAAFRVPKIMDV